MQAINSFITSNVPIMLTLILGWIAYLNHRRNVKRDAAGIEDLKQRMDRLEKSMSSFKEQVHFDMKEAIDRIIQVFRP